MIVCGSGPSLAKVPLYDPGLPVAAVSTAIRYVHRPDYWILVDRMNKNHGPEGKFAAKEAAIPKVVPASRKAVWHEYPNLVLVNRSSKASFFDDTPNMVSRSFNRSMIFAVEFLMKIAGFDVLVFAGLDLRVDPDQPYVHEQSLKANRVNTRNHNHQIELRNLHKFGDQAAKKGILWLNWTPGSPLEGIMGDFDDFYR